MKIKPWHVLILTISFFTYRTVKAEVLHWPQLCTTGELYLKNNSTTNTSAWLQKFGKNLLRETEIEMAALSSLVFPLDPLNNEEKYSLLVINENNLIDVKYKCNNRLYSASSIEGGQLTFKKTSLATNQIWIQNLFTDTNEVQIEFQDLEYKKITSKILNLSSLQSVLFAVPESIKNWSYFKFTASHKSTAFSLTASGNDTPVIVAPQKTEIDFSAHYFLVGPRTGSSDSFIVKITDENLIERARDLIINPQKEKMLFARIQKNHQGFNRNWSKIEKSFWSWSTTEVTDFSDLGSTACNGAPQEVEDRMDYWVIDPGQICFWNYRVKKELTPNEVATGL